MDVIYLLIPLALILLIVAICAFVWAVRSNQFEDLDREAQRILFDEDKPKHSEKKTNSDLDQGE